MSVHATPPASRPKEAYLMRRPSLRPSFSQSRAAAWIRERAAGRPGVALAATPSARRAVRPRGSTLDDDSAGIRVLGFRAAACYLLPAARPAGLKPVCDFPLPGPLPARYSHLRLRPLLSYLLHHSGSLPPSFIIITEPLHLPPAISSYAPSTILKNCPISNSPPVNF